MYLIVTCAQTNPLLTVGATLVASPL